MAYSTRTDLKEDCQGQTRSIPRKIPIYTSTFQGSVIVLFKECIKGLPTPAYFSANISATFSAEFIEFFLGSVREFSRNISVDMSNCPRTHQGSVQGIY